MLVRRVFIDLQHYLYVGKEFLLIYNITCMLVRRVFIDLKHYVYVGKKRFIDLQHYLYVGKKSFYRFTTLLVC
jgi:hypothetical protein